MSENKTVVKLKYPFKANGLEIKELNVRRPKVLDLELIDNVDGEIKKSITLLANLSDSSPDDIRGMDAGDFQQAAELVADFLG